MTNATKQTIHSIIDEMKEELVDFLQSLVSIPSVSASPEEGKAQKIIMKKLAAESSLKIDSWEPSTQEISKYPLHPIRQTSWNYEKRPNVVAILPGKGEGKSLMLNGHIDVVSPEPLQAWKHLPWAGQIREGKLYGRGSMDMKGGLVAMIYAILALPMVT